jgi:ATP-binding cassette subfamily F protein 3
MAKCCNLIKTAFPKINDDIYQYVEMVLETSGEDFESTDDLYDAIGEVLHEMEEDKTEQDIREVCRQILTMLRPDLSSSYKPAQLQKLLTGPVNLGALARGAQEEDEGNSIWMKTVDEESRYVDKDALRKAEEVLKKKQERKEKTVAKPVANKYGSREATASQVLSKSAARAEASGTNNVKDIHLENFDISYGEKVLIKAADVTLTFGRRYGFVGRNGLGKTTLLRMISEAQLMIPSHITVLHVEQEVVGDETLALASVLQADIVREELLKEEKYLNVQVDAGSTDPDISSRLTAVFHQLEAIDSAKAPARAAVILAGLGFTPQMQANCTKTFSGGWRMRIALARALFSKPDLLLLDEPTNMLDMQAVIWLERYLQTWPSTILVVSHDRNFMDEVPTDMLHLHSQRIDTYKGNYTEYYNTMTEKLKSQAREYENQMEYRKHVQEFIDKFRYNAKRAPMVQSRIKMLEKLPVLEPVITEAGVTLRFPEVDKMSGTILMLSEVSFTYPETTRVIFSNVDLSATMESRICIVGENGAGKTTILKMLMDMDGHTPTRGSRTAHRNLKFGYFTQHFVDQLDMTICPVEVMQKEFPGKKVEEYRRMLGQFGVTGDMAVQQIESLSGGQKSRVAFAVLCGHSPNFLILDEPTNHLDIETIEALGHALIKYKGGVILVSHDERLLKMVCQELWICSRGKVSHLYCTVLYCTVQ